MKSRFHKIQLAGLGGFNKTGFRRRRVKINRLTYGFFLLVALVAGVGGFFVYTAGKRLSDDIKITRQSATQAYDALKNQHIEEASQKLKITRDNLLSLKGHVYAMGWIQYVPFIGVYESDAKHLVNAGVASIEALITTVDTLTPYADLLGLKGKSTFVSGSADERIRTAVATLDKIVPNIDAIASKVKVAEEELGAVDVSRYPQKIGSLEVKKNLARSKTLFEETASLFVDAQPLLKKTPELLGNKEPKRYLVIFQNDAELRATGGFITAFALFKVDKGKIQVERSDDIYKLDEAKSKKYPAPNSILKYHKNVFTWELRDSNLSPDFVSSMKDFENMLTESVTDFPDFDGIIALDTHVLVSTIKILGDFHILGRTFSAENDKRCDCPKAIYELEDYSTKPVAYIRDDRKGIIGSLLYEIMQRALGVSPSQYWSKLFQMFLEEAHQKHILFTFKDSQAQSGIEALNFAGRLTDHPGDYLHINDVNFAGAKSNLFVKQSVKRDMSLEGDGTITQTLTITYKNPAPPSNCNLEAGQLCLNGILRNWLRVYVPKGSTLLEFTGSEKDTVTYEDLGKTVFEGFFTVKPQGIAEAKLRYKLPFKAEKGKQLSFYIQKQPGTDANEYTLFNNGKQTDKFLLTTDREIFIKP